jgi:hypothetical protein
MDINETPFSVVQQSTGQKQKPEAKPKKNPAAVALGRLGGLKGGKARAAILSDNRRKEIASQAASKRWSSRSQ